jgi:chorismate synthase
MGGPVALQVANRDYKNWEERMNPWPVEADVPEVHLPRPGHADLAGVQKFGFTDVRNVLERASARETAARVAGGALAKAFLAALGVSVVSHVIQIGSIQAPPLDDVALDSFAGVDASPVRCLDADASKTMVGEINVLRKRNESIGGIFEVRAFGLVPGLGSHVSWEQRLDGLIGSALLSIQAAKGVGLGDGFDLAGRPGSEAHDEIFYSEERGYYRETNRSGGLEGGMTTGEPLVARVAMKPIPTLTKPLRSVDIATKQPAQALRERTDSCVVPAAGVVGEAMLAIVLAGAYRDKFGGDHIDDVRAAVDAYCARIGWKPRS